MRGTPPSAAKAALCLLSFLTACALSGCGYLDEELALSDEAFAMNMTEEAYLDLEELEIYGSYYSGRHRSYRHTREHAAHISAAHAVEHHHHAALSARQVRRINLADSIGAAVQPRVIEEVDRLRSPPAQALWLHVTGAQRHALARAGLSGLAQ